MFELTALAIGFLGSFHCIAMCGPIALAISSSRENNTQYLLSRGIYNLGRVFTYSLLGIIAGLLGQSLLIAGFQKSVSISMGILIIFSVLIINYLPAIKLGSPVLLRINHFIRRIFSKTLSKKNLKSLFLTGLANGILPCGFVYLALAGASSTQNPLNGALYMTLFGLGTIPAMMTVSFFGKIAGLKARILINKVAPVLMIVLGLMLIYRGVVLTPDDCPVHTQTSSILY